MIYGMEALMMNDKLRFDLIRFVICRCPGSTPLHLAAKGGSLDCIRELLAWGADRLQRDASGYIISFSSKFL